MTTRKLFVLALLSIPCLAQAAMIKGEFSGTIISSYDLANSFGAGSGHNTVVGSRVSGALKVDTSLMPIDYYPNNEDIGYRFSLGQSNWITSSITTEFGHTWGSNKIDEGRLGPVGYISDLSSVVNAYDSRSNDSFRLEEMHASIGSSELHSLDMLFYIDISASSSSGANMLDSGDLGQSLLLDSSSPFHKQGGARYHYMKDGKSEAQFSYDFHIDSFAWNLEGVPVDEPSSIWLLLLGLSVVYFRTLKAPEIRLKQGYIGAPF